MALKRTITTTKTVGAKRRKAGKAKSKTAVDKRQDALLRRLDQMIERKFEYVNAQTTMAYNNTNVIELLSTAQGDGTVGERIGAKIAPQFLDLKLFLYPHSNNAVQELARVTVIRSKQRFVPDTAVSGTAASTTALWREGGTAQAALGSFAQDNRNHFEVLYDEAFVILPDNAEGSGNGHYRHIRKKLRGIQEMAFATTTSERGMIYLCFTSTSDSATTPPTLLYNSTVSYKDA